MAPTTVDIGTLITRHEGVKGGRPIIAGTGTSVLAIVERWEMGLDVHEIARQLSVPLRGVFAALAYAEANREEIEELFRLEEEAHERMFGSSS
jgi:uncharacterized protein (DUF433 family)